MTARPDLSVYLILDPAHCAGRRPEAIAAAAAKGGATLVQLRDKTLDSGALAKLAASVRRELAPFGVPLLVNDRVDAALAGGADGVHVGQNDTPAADARRILPDRAIVGLTVRSAAEAEAAPLDRIDYVSIGGVFATTSKTNPDPPIGTAGLGRIAALLRRSTDMPLGAIAGIDAENAAAVIGAGVDGVAVVSAICAVDDPEAAAARLRRVVDDAKAARRTA